MGTRSTITFYSSEVPEEPIVTIYQQYDGYISGVGHNLANWLLKMKLINGIGRKHHKWEYANGIGCLIAKFIRDFKVETGNLYITSPDVGKDCDYNYRVYVDFVTKETKADDAITIKVTNWGSKDDYIFVGSPSELLKFDDE